MAPVDGAEPVFGLAPGVAERVSDLETPPGLFAVVAAGVADAGVLAAADFVVVADRIADPGNLGTILRSAEAAGAEAVVVTPGHGRRDQPEGGAGVGRRAVPRRRSCRPRSTPSRAAGLRLVGTSSHRGVAHTEADWTGRIAIVAGNEAHGLEPDAPIDEWVRIEHRGRAESLNVAMATTVLCFEAARHR